MDMQRTWVGIERVRSAVLALQVLVSGDDQVEIRLVQRETGLMVPSEIARGSVACKLIEEELLGVARAAAVDVADALK